MLEPVLQQKGSTFLLPAARVSIDSAAPDAKGVTMLVIKALLVFILNDFKEIEANCQAGCEKATGRTTDIGLTNRALVGHSFKNFTVNKPFDCFVKCFHERCKCQAYQLKDGRKCELLDDDKFSVPYDLVEEQGYTHFEFNKEYHKGVRNCSLCERNSWIFHTKALITPKICISKIRNKKKIKDNN